MQKYVPHIPDSHVHTAENENSVVPYSRSVVKENNSISAANQIAS